MTVGLILVNSQKKWAPEVLCPNKVPKRTYFLTFSRVCRRHKHCLEKGSLIKETTIYMVFETHKVLQGIS